MLLLQKDLIELFSREIKDWHYITACHLLTIKIVGVIGMGLANVTFVDALISERQPAGIELEGAVRRN